MKAINLKEIFGERYKVVLEEGYEKPRKRPPDPWYFEIPCKYGVIYPYSDTSLGYYSDAPKVWAKLLREHPNTQIALEGDTEVLLLFGVDEFDTIAAFAKPRKKRRVSKKAKSKLVKAGLGTRFKG